MLVLVLSAECRYQAAEYGRHYDPYGGDPQERDEGGGGNGYRTGYPVEPVLYRHADDRRGYEGDDSRTDALEYGLHCGIVLESREDRGYEQYYYKRWNDTSYGGHYASFY